MHNITPPRWALSESAVTPEKLYLNRRQWLAGATALTAAAALPATAAPTDPWQPKPPTKVNVEACAAILQAFCNMTTQSGKI